MLGARVLSAKGSATGRGGASRSAPHDVSTRVSVSGWRRLPARALAPIRRVRPPNVVRIASCAWVFALQSLVARFKGACEEIRSGETLPRWRRGPLAPMHKAQFLPSQSLSGVGKGRKRRAERLVRPRAPVIGSWSTYRSESACRLPFLIGMACGKASRVRRARLVASPAPPSLRDRRTSFVAGSVWARPRDRSTPGRGALPATSLSPKGIAARAAAWMFGCCERRPYAVRRLPCDRSRPCALRRQASFATAHVRCEARLPENAARFKFVTSKHPLFCYSVLRNDDS